MTADRDGFLAHMATGSTTVCRCWQVTRRDGVNYGFTDHDGNLRFDGIDFLASSGMSARAFQQVTGLAVDNSEAVGALSSAAVQEEDLAAGRFDGAEVRCWQVNWRAPDQRLTVFRGQFGEVTRVNGSFRVELRGLPEVLNQPQGRVFQSGCSAVLGDARCGIDLSQPGHRVEAALAEVDSLGGLWFDGLPALAEGWFARGSLMPVEGAGAGIATVIRRDTQSSGRRRIELWHQPALPLAVGSIVRLTVGCDRTASTCKAKFANFDNFRGFPHIPGEDWLASYPTSTSANTGGSRLA